MSFALTQFHLLSLNNFLRLFHINHCNVLLHLHSLPPCLVLFLFTELFSINFCWLCSLFRFLTLSLLSLIIPSPLYILYACFSIIFILPLFYLTKIIKICGWNLPPKDNNTKDICALKCIIRLPSSPSKQPSVFLNFPVPFNQVLHIKQLHIFRTPCSKLFRQLFQKENRDLFSSCPFIVSFPFPFAQPPLYDLDAFMLNNSKHNKIYSKKR